MKPILLAGAEPLAITAVRLLFAALIICLISLFPVTQRKDKTVLTPALLGQTIGPGFMGYCVCSSLLLYAFAHMNTGIATTLGSLSPVMLLPILWVKDTQRPPAPAIAGTLIAVFGTSVIFML